MATAAEEAVAAGGGSEEGDAAGAGGGRDGGSSPFRFSFHARSFSGVETTPRFGSFNPADDLAVFQPKPPAPPVDAPSKDVVEVAAGDGDGDETTAEEEGSDGNSHLLGLYPSEAKPIE
uniref:Uncharacterized protein n=1 Tax=Oryza brachyantha TaxID=4533 RepID=J3M8G4_ORYBR